MPKIRKIGPAPNDSDVHTKRCGGKKLRFQVTVVANGTITELVFNNATLAPLQWRRHKTDDEAVRPAAMEAVI